MQNVPATDPGGNPAPQQQPPPAPPPERPKRTASLWEATAGRWVLTLTEFPPRSAAQDTHYHVYPQPSQWGRAFRLEKLPDSGGETYLVLLDDRPTCSCPGFGRHKHCKHVEAPLALQANGKLDALQAPAAKEVKP